MTFITSTINEHMYIKILDNFLIPSRENWLGDDEVIFPDYDASCLRANKVKAFLKERNIKINTLAYEASRYKSNCKNYCWFLSSL